MLSHILIVNDIIYVNSAVEKQMQISLKSNGSFLPKMEWVVKIFICIVWILLNQPNCFVNESVYISSPINAQFSPIVITVMKNLRFRDFLHLRHRHPFILILKVT